MQQPVQFDLVNEVTNCTNSIDLHCVMCSKQSQKIDIRVYHVTWDYGNNFSFKNAVDKSKVDLF